MNRQKVFNRVATHLIKQNAKAISTGGTCLFLDKDSGRKCAVGVLIPKRFSPENIMGGVGGLSDRVLNAIGVSKRRKQREDDIQFLDTLQNIHDLSDPPLWPDRLRALAKAEKLRYGFIRELARA